MNKKDEAKINSVKYIENIAKLDIFRELRRGVPEVIFAENKEYQDLVRIITTVVSEKNYAVVSKINSKNISKLFIHLKKKNLLTKKGINCSSIMVHNRQYKRSKSRGRVGIICAGTSDIGIAEEARLITEAMGCETISEYDVGISAMHRTMEAANRMLKKNVHVIIVIAGMEGALASVISSLMNIPVIGVPSSTGYGFGSHGTGALMSMLQSCTLGMAVVNIDNGIGAGAFAALIAKQSK